MERKKGTTIIAAALLTVFGIAGSALAAPDRPAAQTAAPGADAAAKQRALDLEHDMMQSDGVNHPREKAGKGADKALSPKAAPTKKSQRDLDLEHEMMQSDGVNHPREKVGAKKAAAAAKPAAPESPKKTQKELDQEHERMLSDGTYHPREVLKK